MSRSALRGMLRRRAVSLPLGLALLAANLVLVNYIATRHYVRADWTASGVYSLSARTVAMLRSLRVRVEMTVFMVPPERRGDSVLDETMELLRRFASHSDRVHVQYVDPDLDPARADLLAKRFGVNKADLREGGVAVVAGKRSKFVSAAAMARYRIEGGVQRLAEFRGEAALLEALLAVTRREQRVVCFTTGHGEAPIDTYAETGYGYIADDVRRDGYVVRGLAPGRIVRSGGLRDCTVVVIGGPNSAFTDPELEAIDRFLRHGGRLFVLLGPVLDRKATRLRRVGLEPLLARWGARVMENIVVDPMAVPGEQPLMTWATRQGYGDHPIGRALEGHITVWPLTREVRLSAGSGSGAVLVRTSPDGWAETDLASLRGERPLRLDRAVDTPGPVSVAVATWRGSTRMVVLGTERGVLNRRLGRLAVRDYNRDLFLAAVGWLVGSADRIAVGPKTPERLRLVLDERQMGRVFLLTVVALPGAALLIGLLVWRRRRR